MFRKPKLAKIFEDTQKFYSNNDILKENVKELRANTKFYEADEYPVVTNNGNRLGTITVTKSRTFEAAMRLDKEHVGKKIAVLNLHQRQHQVEGSLAEHRHRRNAFADAQHCIHQLIEDGFVTNTIM